MTRWKNDQMAKLPEGKTPSQKNALVSEKTSQ